MWDNPNAVETNAIWGCLRVSNVSDDKYRIPAMLILII